MINETYFFHQHPFSRMTIKILIHKFLKYVKRKINHMSKQKLRVY